MSKATFSVSVIRKERDQDYYDFWTRSFKKNASGEELHSDLVGFTETVEAKNKQEAILLVKKMYPGLSIDTKATKRLG